MLFWLHLLYKLGKEKMKKLDVRTSLLRLQACHGVACVCVCVYTCHTNLMSTSLKKKKKNVTNSFPIPPSPRVSLCIIHNGAEHLAGVSAALLRSVPGGERTAWRGAELSNLPLHLSIHPSIHPSANTSI